MQCLNKIPLVDHCYTNCKIDHLFLRDLSEIAINNREPPICERYSPWCMFERLLEWYIPPQQTLSYFLLISQPSFFPTDSKILDPFLLSLISLQSAPQTPLIRPPGIDTVGRCFVFPVASRHNKSHLMTPFILVLLRKSGENTCRYLNLKLKAVYLFGSNGKQEIHRWCFFIIITKKIKTSIFENLYDI